MTTIDVSAAPGRLLARKSVVRAHCLTYIVEDTLNGRPSLNPALTAREEWDQTPAEYKHSDDRSGAKGLPAYFSGAGGAGDVAFLMGDGIHLATIDPNRKYGATGIQTIDSRADQVGGEYLGYATWIAGYTLTNPSTEAASTGAATILGALMSSLTGRIELEDKKLGVFYAIDLFAPVETGGVILLGTKGSLEYLGVSKGGSSALKVATGDIQNQVNARGINLTGWPAERIARLPKGTVTAKTAA